MGNPESKPAAGAAEAGGGGEKQQAPDCGSRIKECVNGMRSGQSASGRGGAAGTARAAGGGLASYAELLETYKAVGQEHVLAHYESLTAEQKVALMKQLNSIDPAAVLTRYQMSTSTSKDELTGDVEPCSPTRLDLTTPETVQGWEDVAYKAISEGKVGVILLAGGQGTRLGFSQPKGCFPGDDAELVDAWLPTGKTLFALHAERIRRLQQLAAERTGATAGVIQWYIMTSPMTHDDSRRNLEANGFYGLAATQVHLFQQGCLPCIGEVDGKFIMNSPHEVATAPDGNGGIYAALHNSGMIEDMDKRGVKYLFANAIDNCVCKIADPKFLGFCVAGQFKAANKVTEKRSPDEKVGIQCRRNGAYEVVEYSDVAEAVRDQRDEATGKLLFSSGSVCIHYYTLDFLKTECHPEGAGSTALPYHVARKAIPYYDEATQTVVKPPAVNGVKLETFIFDVFKLAGESFGVFEVQREEEFAPIKNKSVGADGKVAQDSPVASLAQMSGAQKRWLVAAGAKLVDQDGNDASQADSLDVEISPLVSYGGEGLEGMNGLTITLPCAVVERGFRIRPGTRLDYTLRHATEVGPTTLVYTAKPLQLPLDE